MNEISKVILFIVLLIFFVLVILLINNSNLGEFFLEYRKSTNGKLYGIQEIFKDADLALELIAKLHNNMNSFVTKLKAKYPNDERVIRLVKGFSNVEIEETTENQDDDNTSFTINKGELMSLCVRIGSESHKNRPLHDYNTLCFVIIHEMAHIASISEGHNFEFIENFKFLLNEAVDMGYYIPVDYSKNPFLYCGKIKVTNNPYY
jgi:hypothetical protein